MATTAAAALSTTTPPEQRLCSEAALDALCNELTAYYFQRQEDVSPSAAVDAIGARFGRRGSNRFSTSTSSFIRSPPLSLFRLFQLNSGYRIGRALAERASLRREGLRHPTTLDAVKHACKEVWTLAFGKQVDALRTNHRGTFVLRDSSFRRLASLSADVSSLPVKKKTGMKAGAEGEQRDTAAPALAAASAAAAAATTLRLHAGIVRGALSALGVEADVTAASPLPPAAEFTVIVRSEDGE